MTSLPLTHYFQEDPQDLKARQFLRRETKMDWDVGDQGLGVYTSIPSLTEDEAMRIFQERIGKIINAENVKHLKVYSITHSDSLSKISALLSDHGVREDCAAKWQRFVDQMKEACSFLGRETGMNWFVDSGRLNVVVNISSKTEEEAKKIFLKSIDNVLDVKYVKVISTTGAEGTFDILASIKDSVPIQECAAKAKRS